MPRRTQKPSRPREESIEWRVPDGTRTITIDFDPNTGKIHMPEADPSKTKIKRSYTKESGKVKNLTQFSPEGATYLNPDFGVVDEFDRLVAIDTNTREINGNRVSITTAYITDVDLNVGIKKVPFSNLVVYASWGHKCDAEKLGWYLVMRNKLRPKKGDLRLGIVVDAHLDEHGKINRREIPFFSRFLLPSKFSLVYASDAAKEGLPNQMLRYCETSNRNIFKLNESLFPLLTPDRGYKIESYSGRFIELAPVQK